jgi:hypothetical protein
LPEVEVPVFPIVAYGYYALHKDWMGQAFLATTDEKAKQITASEINLRAKGRYTPKIVFEP